MVLIDLMDSKVEQNFKPYFEFCGAIVLRNEKNTPLTIDELTKKMDNLLTREQVLEGLLMGVMMQEVLYSQNKGNIRFFIKNDEFQTYRRLMHLATQDEKYL